MIVNSCLQLIEKFYNEVTCPGNT